MKITILQENLQKAISLASRFTTNKAQLPILGNILITSNKTRLNICSTNLEISISTSVGAKIEEEGQISIPSKVIADIIANLPKDNLDLLTENEQVKIKSGSFSTKILGMDGTDFPKIPTGLTENIIILKKDLLNKTLGKTIYATSSDETRPVLTGVLFIFKKKEIEIVATDGFRLSKYFFNAESNFEGRVVLPKNVLSEVSRIEEVGENIEFECNISEKQALFGIGDSVISSRIIEGDYPDYEKIIPKSSTISIFVDKLEFERAIKLASVFARTAANVVKIKLEKDKIKVSSESSESGSQEAEVDAKIVKTDELMGGESVAFNYKFIEDFIRSVDGEEIKMELTDAQKAVVFTDTSDSNYLHLIMPVRVQ